MTRPSTIRTSRRWTRWLLVVCLCAGSSALVLGDHRVQDARRRSARRRASVAGTEALASFQLEPGYRIELAAAEPLIKDPVAMAFDDRGECTSSRIGATPARSRAPAPALPPRA